MSFEDIDLKKLYEGYEHQKHILLNIAAIWFDNTLNPSSKAPAGLLHDFSVHEGAVLF